MAKQPQKKEYPYIAIFSVDPGTVSGVARGYFPAKTESVWEGLAQGKWESWETDGPTSRQAWEIVGEYAEWTGGPGHPLHWERGASQWAFTMEGFTLRLGTGASSRRELLDPVRVAEGCATLCLQRNGLPWVELTYQQPSAAKNFATNDRLRRAGLWVKGSEHRRDAVRHMALRYAHMIGARK